MADQLSVLFKKLLDSMSQLDGIKTEQGFLSSWTKNGTFIYTSLAGRWINVFMQLIFYHFDKLSDCGG